MATLLVTPPAGGEPWRVSLPEGPFLVGREAGLDLVLEDPAASRRHARLEPGPSGWTVTDLDSSNGTFRNRARVARALLEHGDVLRIGATHLRFEDPPLVDLPPPAEEVRSRRGLLLGLGLVAGLAALGGGLWLFRKPAPAPASSPAAAPRPPAPEPLKLDLVLRARVAYDQAFDGGDQEWPAEQELVLELKDLPATLLRGVFQGSRRTRDATDRVEGRLQGGRLTGLRWQATRLTVRSMADGREEKAREETWDLQADDLAAEGPDQPFTWRSFPVQGAPPRLRHQLLFHPQAVTVRSVKVDWPSGGKREAEAPLECRIRR